MPPCVKVPARPEHAAAAGPTGRPRGAIFIGAPTTSARPSRRSWLGALFEDAFRPFYLGGAAFAALAIPLWIGMWRGEAPPTSLAPLFWHAHEMVYGFAGAIITGFLFTAARNWTGLPLPAGAVLGALFAVWAAARVGMALWYGPVIAAGDLVHLLIVAAVLARKFMRARSRASIPLLTVLSALVLSNAAFHASMLGLLEFSPLRAVEAGLLCVVLVELIVAGRVVPAFTASAVPGVAQFRARRLERLMVGAAAAAFAADILGVAPGARATLAIIAGAGIGAQLIGWSPVAALGRPMLWILHLSYAWISAGLLLLGLAAFDVVPRTAAIHALTVGSMGGLIIGMITRTALAHSGRPVIARRSEVSSFVLVQAAAGVRVAGALVPAIGPIAVMTAGAMWSAAFAIYFVTYLPILTRPRIGPGAAPAAG
ncbi:MAG: NnrS family protein [Phycisphaerales bacterium]|nr:NnrS family protein [Phycisphaerales bacterium]